MVLCDGGGGSNDSGGGGKGNRPSLLPPPAVAEKWNVGNFPRGKARDLPNIKLKNSIVLIYPTFYLFLSFNIDASALTNVVEFSTLFPLEVAGRAGGRRPRR